MVNRNVPPQNQSSFFMGGGGGGNNSYLDASQLKELDVPMETVIGGANGAIQGLLMSAIASAAISAITNKPGQKPGTTIVGNLKGGHLIPVAMGTVVFTALGAYVRNTKARLHNKWAEQQTSIMEQETKAFTAREQEKADKPATAPATPAR